MPSASAVSLGAHYPFFQSHRKSVFFFFLIERGKKVLSLFGTCSSFQRCVNFWDPITITVPPPEIGTSSLQKYKPARTLAYLAVFDATFCSPGASKVIRVRTPDGEVKTWKISSPDELRWRLDRWSCDLVNCYSQQDVSFEDIGDDATRGIKYCLQYTMKGNAIASASSKTQAH